MSDKEISCSDDRVEDGEECRGSINSSYNNSLCLLVLGSLLPLLREVVVPCNTDEGGYVSEVVAVHASYFFKVLGRDTTLVAINTVENMFGKEL